MTVPPPGPTCERVDVYSTAAPGLRRIGKIFINIAIMVDKKNNEEPNASKDTKQSTAKFSGKGARQRTQEKFRRQVGKKQMQERHDKIDQRWGLSAAEMEEVNRSLSSIHVPTINKARPVTVATRSVGFACAVEYKKIVTTWNFGVISEICSVHQLWPFIFCGHVVSKPVPPRLAWNLISMLEYVVQAPICLANLLSCVGKITSGSSVWHCCIPEPTAENIQDVEFAYTYLRPDNIRSVLEIMVYDAPAEQAYRQEFRNYPIPGVAWRAGNTIANIDDIWPAEYNHDNLREDIGCFNALLTRSHWVQFLSASCSRIILKCAKFMNMFPKHFNLNRRRSIFVVSCKIAIYL
ncbi:uncharacterized protein LOC117218766 isoform X2 [Megalopta genalis]|uniref:uncharacterized protein LOC117218766 isoform X2 n=1 Tax=Megalopta genalis TaxID=115081 RepID=UPI003FD11D6B